ncbi:uncharacterized protein A1O9_09827 [Exophiala aquamarina CBS 119918]|uniref:Transcription factor domain-containing protein n=1 Tax=Exophiala aquamarina CBS 119918 TaxID=1182545 RepID=A0A072P2V5_9EURO|nr:uncharacterized protein A1O9_09827 [Exophiala aquamarina CBS 119918]KEF54032.1 hypothetical protein A1O9_09827 [Exophiala aquamarina CBS 119918]
MPSTAASWKATSEAQWRDSPRTVEYYFRDLLSSFFKGSERWQQLNPLRLPLRTWQLSWELTSESTLDPLSSKAPLAFNGIELFRTAYMRLLPNFNPDRGFFLGESHSGGTRNGYLRRSRYLTIAILYAAHALSIPVRLGVELIARTYIPFWSIEHSLCSFDCATLLNIWLKGLVITVHTNGMDGLKKSEKWLLSILTDIIKETSFAQALGDVEGEASRSEQMSKTVVHLWARIFSGAHVYEIDNVVKARFDRLAGLSQD